MSRIEIDLTSPRQGRIAVNGQDLANHTRGFRLDAQIGNIPTLHLDLVVLDATEIRAEGVKILMDPGVAELLIKAGWTPPAHADPRDLTAAFESEPQP